jgi:ribosomal protein S27AE
MAEADAWAARWRELSEQVLSEMQQWRAAHPRATLAEIEAETEAGIVRLRARMVEETAHASAARDWREQPAAERPRCPNCGRPLQARGEDARHLTLPGEQRITLQRQYGTCPACGTGLFPPG